MYRHVLPRLVPEVVSGVCDMLDTCSGTTRRLRHAMIVTRVRRTKSRIRAKAMRLMPTTNLTVDEEQQRGSSSGISAPVRPVSEGCRRQ
jgi:hypothetical protein